MKAQHPRYTESITRDKYKKTDDSWVYHYHDHLFIMFLPMLPLQCVLIRLPDLFVSNYIMACFFRATVMFLTDPEHSFHCA